MASDDLYLLDLRQGEEQAQWIIVPIVGPTPGRRYGHIITFCRPYLTVFGGNTGSEPVNDSWFMCVDKAPFTWNKIIPNSETPPPRVYHSGAQCLSGAAAGMTIVFGGRTTDQSALNDTWGLRRHRDGSWDWVKAPHKPNATPPIARYQHNILFINSMMLVMGGRTNHLAETVPLQTYDTETSEWTTYTSLKRFRHACFWSEEFVYAYGGFEQDTPNLPTSTLVRFGLGKVLIPKESAIKKDKVQEEAKIGSRFDMGKSAGFGGNILANPSQDKRIMRLPTASGKEEEKVFKLSSQAHVAVSCNLEDPHNDFANLVKRVSIDKLQEESKKLGGKPKVPILEEPANPKDSAYSMFISFLLKPKEYSVALTSSVFQFTKDSVTELAREFQLVLQSQPSLVNIRTPVKIFGNLHGNFCDLMRFFDFWKAPAENSLGGDIDSFAYVFMGNYVDRGSRCLETVCLLMSLKLKYPDQIYLLRGNHEDRSINAVYGFGEECKARLHEDISDPESVYQTINNAFGWLPLAVVIENKILCIHAGIGPNIKKLDDLLKIARPIELSQEGAAKDQGTLLDSLWSDPTATDMELGYWPNYIRGNGNSDSIVKFGSDKVQEFLAANKLEMLIRGHEIALDGFDTFASGKLITVTSCTNYCGKHNNSACMLVVQKTFEISPKLLLPLPETAKLKTWIDDEESLKKRPPTPPRQRSSGT